MRRIAKPMEWDIEIDAQGLRCPLPVLRLRQRLAVLAPGQVVRLVADDPMAVVDVPHFCTEGRHRLIAQSTEGGVPVFYVAKSASGGAVDGGPVAR
jgi:tRNA 2-thiouridine synthesizing protein A